MKFFSKKPGVVDRRFKGNDRREFKKRILPTLNELAVVGVVFFLIFIIVDCSSSEEKKVKAVTKTAPAKTPPAKTPVKRVSHMELLEQKVTKAEKALQNIPVKKNDTSSMEFKMRFCGNIAKNYTVKIPVDISSCTKDVDVYFKKY